MSIRVVAYSTKQAPGGGSEQHVFIITPDKLFPLWKLQRAVSESILIEKGIAVGYSSTEECNLRLILTDPAEALRLLRASGQLPDIRRAIEAM